MATLDRIPQEIIEDNILTRLPVMSILRFKCVCKYWCNNLFQNPRFVNMQLQHANAMNKINLLVSEINTNSKAALYSIDHNILLSLSSSLQDKGVYNPFMSQWYFTEIHGSCNGLVCIKSGDNHDEFCIWNPCTKEYKLVPKTLVEFPLVDVAQKSPLCIAYGFGYDCKIDDYKLLRIVDFSEYKVSEVRVYTLGSNSWKKLGFISHVFSGWKERGILVDSDLHWLASTYHNTSTGFENRVVSFNIADETFRHTPLPGSRFLQGITDLIMWEGKVCLVGHDSKNNFTVWMMKDYTWRKHLSITKAIFDGRICGKPIQLSTNGEILFMIHRFEEDKSRIVSYDPKLESTRVLDISGVGSPMEMEPYIETLVSLKSGTFARAW